MNNLFILIHNLLTCHNIYLFLHDVTKKMVRFASIEESGSNNISVNYDSHLRFSALIDLISALISSSVSPSCVAVFCACSISE